MHYSTGKFFYVNFHMTTGVCSIPTTGIFYVAKVTSKSSVTWIITKYTAIIATL